MENSTESKATPGLTLTLTPELDDAPAPVLSAKPVEELAKDEGDLALDDSMLSDDEKKMVEEFSEQINVRDSAAIMQYGAGAQKKMADFSESALERVRTNDLGEVGDLITGVVNELRGFNATEEKGLFGFFKRGVDKVQSLRTRYDKAEANVNKIVDQLKDHQMTLVKDAATLDKMYELNLTYFKELTMYLLAGKKKLAQVREGELVELVEHARATGRAEDAQAAQDLEAMCTRFEKKLGDLDLTRTIAMQTAPQIRLVQNNEITLVEKIQTTIVNTIPLWKNQMVLALGMAHSQQAMQAERAVTDATNELLRKNAATLKQGTIDIAKESERGVVDIETLQQTNRDLISTLDELNKIRADGKAKRAAAEQELGRIEGELKQKLLEINK